jgi:hypothetical protein
MWPTCTHLQHAWRDAMHTAITQHVHSNSCRCQQVLAVQVVVHLAEQHTRTHVRACDSSGDTLGLDGDAPQPQIPP